MRSSEAFVFWKTINPMNLKATVTKKEFTFSFKARTSRGLMKNKVSWFIHLWDEAAPEVVGIGEAGPLPGLSVDAVPDFEEHLSTIVSLVSGKPSLENDLLDGLVPPELPSIRFALETAWLDLVNGGRKIIYDNSFLHGSKIPINGLIWMGDLDFMMSQINQKIAQGFDCIKLKVGGLDFDRECDVLQYIRKRYFRSPVEIRLDANGAFKLDDALYKLNELAKFDVQSIEQPIKGGQPEMEELCRKSPIPIALDEELIGIHSLEDKASLLQRLKPRYIILKPSLVGGLAASAEWIRIAGESGVGWWVTSALESNIGLNAICQFTANYPVTLHHGLGTGSIYHQNVGSPLEVGEGMIFLNPAKQWDDSMIRA
jgi:o-succinylbenzoate synthase